MQLNDNDIAILKDNQYKGIQKKTLSDEQLELIYRKKWFKIWVPKSLGGLELNLVEGLVLLEDLAYWDGGFAWTTTLCAGANLFVGFIDTTVGDDIFAAKEVCFGGSGQVSGVAEREGTGYRLKGIWKYATGAPHLTHFTLNARIQEAGQPVFDKDGNPLVKSFFVNRDDVLIHYDWDTFGLEATASHSFSLNDVFAYESQSFSIDASRTTRGEYLYQYPFMPFAELTLLVNFMGMYHRFIDLVEKLFIVRSNESKWDPVESKAAFKILDTLQQNYLDKRKTIMALAEHSWKNLYDKGDNSSLFERIATESRNFVAEIVTNITKVYPYTGIAGAAKDNEINIIFRNVFTASQHKLLQKNANNR